MVGNCRQPETRIRGQVSSVEATHPPGADQRYIMDFHWLAARVGTIVPPNSEFGIIVNGF
jgi:hypothetical protein